MTDQVPASELLDWLRKSLSSNISQAERERDKLVAEISRALNSVTDFCGQLSRKAEKDMESKRENRAQYRAAKAVSRLATIIPDMCKEFSVPSEKNSLALRNLQRETSKLATEAARTREAWLRQIRPYYIIDMMTLGGNIDKLRRLSDELHTFLQGRGTLLHSLEDLSEKVDSLSKLRGWKDAASSQTLSVRQKLAETEELDSSLRKQVHEIRQNPKVKEYMRLDDELRALRSDLIRTGFSRLGRPLKKLLSISERGDYPLPIDVRENAREYARKPFATFLREEKGYPRLKTVMSALAKAVSSGKLALKQREANKVRERAEQVVSEDSLAKIHEKSLEAKRTYDRTIADTETASLVDQLRQLRQQGKTNQAKQDELKAELQRTVANEKRFEEQMEYSLKDIETFSHKHTGTDVKVQLD
jgi:hypothetical protein